MLMGTTTVKTTTDSLEPQFIALFKQLDAANQATLIAFAEFLASCQPPKSYVVAQPNLLPRPEQETVVKALKRLKASYPMLESDVLLHAASALMTEHIMQGRAAKEVIDDLEQLFAKQYQQLLIKTL